MKKLKIAFVCVHNSCRSQMAEAFMKKLGSDYFESYSAGTEISKNINQKTIEVMKEENICLINHKPKLISDIPNNLDYVIKMGCNVKCPLIYGKKTLDWGLEDPSKGNINLFRKIRNEIKINILSLIDEIKNKEK